jgi:uncharacterized membrane protein YtjA (UPF0391 family)
MNSGMGHLSSCHDVVSDQRFWHTDCPSWSRKVSDGDSQELDRRIVVTIKLNREVEMLYYALVFLIVALVAGALGFGFVAFAAAGIAKICFFLFLIMFVVSLIMHVGRGRTI